MTQEINTLSSPNDHRHYRYLTLDNGMKALLVEDNKTTQAAVSVAVNVGHFDDPESRFGMAHFLEHMLFLGTEKYPDAGEYHEFINHYGGAHNAWTGTEHTNFFCSADPDVLIELIDRFSQFFIAPLFDVELVERERNAIESEYSMKLNDDIRRFYDVEKQCCDQRHPFAKFSVGNLSTLAGDPAELRKELLNFYQQKYSANLMTLCLIAPESLDNLETLAIEHFGRIENKELSKNYPDVPWLTPATLTQQISIRPLKKQKRLNISFALPNIQRYYQQKPLTFISHLLGNETQGSLLSYLKSKGWVNHLSVGGGSSGYNFKEFCVSFLVTQKGLDAVDEIVQTTFEYIELIKLEGLSQWRYQERSNLLEQAFSYQEQIKPLELVSHLSLNLHHYPAEDIIFGDYRMDGLIEEDAITLLDMLNCDNMRLLIVDQDLSCFSNDKVQLSPWYQTEYVAEAITTERLNSWRHPIPRSELVLPLANPFIIRDIEPRWFDYHQQTPEVLTEGKGFRFWYKKDQLFHVPKGHIYLAIDSLNASNTVRQAMLTRLYTELLLDYLTEHTYAAEVAGLGYHLYPHQAGLTLHISGFSPKQPQLLELVINKARERNFKPERFELIKNQMLRNWYNISKTRPISQLFSALTVTLQQRNYDPIQLAQELESATLEELHLHVQNFYKATYLEGLIYGDWLKPEAQQICSHVTEILSLVSAPSPEANRELVNLTSKGTLLRQVEIDHQDSAILMYFQSSKTSIFKIALFSLLNHTMSSKFFHKLRTQKQLGYMLGTNYLPLNRHPGMIFYIQSPTNAPDELLKEIDDFIDGFAGSIQQFTQHQWQQVKLGLINQIMEHDPNLKTRGQRYWTSIGNKDYKFDHREQVVNEIKYLTKEDLITFLNNKMANNREKNADRVIIYSCGHQHKQSTIENGQVIDSDLTKFKQMADKFSL
ncbi:MAG: insulinase family protein [Parashewanella sp.]